MSVINYKGTFLSAESAKSLIRSLEQQLDAANARVAELEKDSKERIGDALAAQMEIHNIDNFNADLFNRDGRQFEVICQYVDGKSVVDTLDEQRSRITELENALHNVMVYYDGRDINKDTVDNHVPFIANEVLSKGKHNDN